MTTPDSAPLMVAPFQLESLEQATSGAEPEPKGRGRHAAAPPRRWTLARTLVVVALVVVLAVAGLVVVRLGDPAAVARVTSTVRPVVAIPARPVSLPWAATGQSAIAVPAIGVAATSGPESPVPIASLTKMMTAYVILRDHPLALGESGPDITITLADVADYETDTGDDQANAAVAPGEVLTELQMLQGLLVHSANNFADALALWDAGSLPAFVTKMNQAAAQLDMVHTHYVDASGFDPGSVSTAGDTLIVAAHDMTNPTFASIVHMTSVTLPVAGTITSYTPLVGFLGVIGVKSGFTTAAGGCDVMAVTRTVHGHSVLILASVIGQTSKSALNILLVAGFEALVLVDAVSGTIGSTNVIGPGSVVAHVAAAGHTVDAVAQSSVSLLTWPGAKVEQFMRTTRTVTAGDRRGTRVGSVVVGLGTQHAVDPVRLGRDLPGETLRQRLL
ncbi:MAG: D-alanyl-D-alanine carboxypeptidase family protein [Acidimicrobiales bacterium]